MHIIAVANQKGGVGKTTTTVSLAEQALKHTPTASVLCVDLDPQASLTAYFRAQNLTKTHTVTSIFSSNTPMRYETLQHAIIRTRHERLMLLPAERRLSLIERAVGHKHGQGLILARALASVTDYDWIIIDCPPSMNVLLINAIAAASLIVIPVQAEYLAIAALQPMLATIAKVERTLGRACKRLIVPTRFDATRASFLSLAALKRQYAASMWAATIPNDNTIAETALRGLMPSHLMPNSPANQQYARLWQDIICMSGDKQSLDMAEYG